MNGGLQDTCAERTLTHPQRSSARVVKWRGALPPRNTRSPNFAAGDGSVKQGRLAATWPRPPTASPGQRGSFTERRKRSVLARGLAAEARSELLGLALTTLRTGRRLFFQAVVLGDRHAYLEALTAGLALELVNSHVSPHLLKQVQRCGRRLSTRNAARGSRRRK